MILEIHPYSPQGRYIEQAAKVLKDGGVVIFPTSTSYVFSCAIHSKKAMQRIYHLKEIDKKKPLTFICNDTAQFQEYTRGIPTPIYRQIKALLPGPYCFIFEASKMIPKVLLSARSTIGVKVPDAPIANALVEAMGEPILTSSVPREEAEQMMMDGQTVHDKYHKLVDLVVDGGDLFLSESAMVDFSVEPPEVIREGNQDLSWLYG